MGDEGVTSRAPEAAVARVEVDAGQLRALLGQQDSHLLMVEQALGVSVRSRDGFLEVIGEEQAVAGAARVLEGLHAVLRQGRDLTTADVRYAVRAAQREAPEDVAALLLEPIVITARGTPVRARTAGQGRFIEAAAASDLVFCTGPAGTGKTYLAMALAVAALRRKAVSRIVLTRPIVEAGESLGFLPGDVAEKVDPYLRPLHDALHDILGPDKFQRHRQRGTIEVVPLAYMRGRTINDAFLVLDEAQNTSPAQMKMALTRIGLGSRMVVTGDPSQSDLPEGVEPGLVQALRVLHGVRGIAVCKLTGADIVRHDLVQRIVSAYGRSEQAAGETPVAP